MDRMPEAPPCIGLADDLAALALNSLTGREHAAVVEHVEHCASCALELESLSAGADALLALYPDIDPDDGFAERVLRRIETESMLTARRPKQVFMAVAASIVVLALAIGLGAVLTGGGPGDRGTSATAILQSPSGPKGNVLLTTGPPSWLVMTLHDEGASGVVACRVTLADGSKRTIGRFALHDGYGSWAIRVPSEPSPIVTVTVEGRGGVVASAEV